MILNPKEPQLITASMKDYPVIQNMWLYYIYDMGSPDAIPRCAEIWHEVLGKIWLPDISVERVVLRFTEHLNEDILTSCSTFLNGI